MGDVSGIAARVRRATLDQPATLGDGDCEALRPGLLGQPVNTVSSLAYVVAGVQVAARSVRAPSATEGGALAYAAFAMATWAGAVWRPADADDEVVIDLTARGLLPDHDRGHAADGADRADR